MRAHDLTQSGHGVDAERRAHELADASALDDSIRETVLCNALRNLAAGAGDEVANDCQRLGVVAEGGLDLYNSVRHNRNYSVHQATCTMRTSGFVDIIGP